MAPKGFASTQNRVRQETGYATGDAGDTAIRIGYDKLCGAGVYKYKTRRMARCDGCNLFRHPETWRESGELVQERPKIILRPDLRNLRRDAL